VIQCTIVNLPQLEPGPRSGPKKARTPHRTLEQARVSARDKVKQARSALVQLERRHDRAAAKVENLSRRKKTLDLELGDAEAERDRTKSRLAATRAALDAAEARLLALEKEE
jgi:septal ring factor EnvC (AmiA/AmiB activator)